MTFLLTDPKTRECFRAFHADLLDPQWTDEHAERAAYVVSGAVDLIDPVDSVLVKQLSANPKVRVEPLPSAMSWAIFLDHKVKPFDDVRVRRAIKLAVDRKLILDTVYQGLGVTTPDVPLPPGDPMFPSDLGDGAQDIPGAKKLLAEAGFPDGIAFTLYTSPILPGMVDLAVTFAESVKPAAHDAFQIASSLLYAIAVAMIIYGVVIIAMLLLYGRERLAR